MAANIAKILCVILVSGCVFAKRVSQLKCAEISKLRTDPRSKQPHAMEMVKIKQIDNPRIQDTTQLIKISSICMGTLISEDFVLTSAHCTRFTTFSDLKVRKYKLLEDQYTDNQLLNIKRLIQHELYNLKINSDFDIGLVQLEKAIFYQNTTTIYRPACLWTKGLSELYATVYWASGKKLMRNVDGKLAIKTKLKPVTLVENLNCSIIFKSVLPLNAIHSHNICVNSSSDNDYRTIRGSAIETKVAHQDYIIGISTYSLDKPDSIILGTSVIPFKLWIESIVWPNNNDLLLEIDCGQRKIKHKPLISFGDPTYHGEFPWHVGLYRITGGRENNQKYICGGVILSEKIVLTVAHCVEDSLGILPPNRISVLAGQHNLNQYPLDARFYSVNSIKVHENYNRFHLESDIALLKIRGTIEFSNYIQPICITRKFNITSHIMGTITGWGLNEKKQESDVLLQIQLPVRSHSDCRESNRNFFSQHLNENNYCAGGFENGTNVCSGDSGGGMFIKIKSRYYLRGLVSFGVALPGNQCDITQMILMTDVLKFYDWMLNNIKILDNTILN